MKLILLLPPGNECMCSYDPQQVYVSTQIEDALSILSQSPYAALAVHCLYPSLNLYDLKDKMEAVCLEWRPSLYLLGSEGMNKLCAERLFPFHATAGEIISNISPHPNEKYQLAQNILGSMRMSRKLKGYRLLCKAVVYVAQNEELIQNAQHMLYPLLAKDADCSVQSVERNIRTAIESVWNSEKYDMLLHLFGNTISAQRGKLTNLAFIAQLAQYVRQKTSTN